MRGCEECRGLLHAYVDGELPAADSLAIEVHLVECPACAAEYQALRVVVDTVRGARPVYEAPEEGREAVKRLILGYRRGLWRRRAALAAACAALFAIAAFSYVLTRNGPFERFAASAARAHQRFVGGDLSLDLRSGDGPAVSAWLGQRLPFQVTLPKYPDLPGGIRRYTLVGARLLPFEDRNLAFVAYRMQEKPVSLLAAAASAVGRMSGRVHRSGALDFYFLSRGGLEIIAWSDRGVSYALVSDAQGSTAASCVVCHGTDAERLKFERLIPATGPLPVQ